MSEKFKKLRLEAEKSIQNKNIDFSQLTNSEIKRIIHDLEVHQIELEMQNDELLATRTNLEQTKDKYFDLFEFAPIGYVRLHGEQIINEVNHTFVELVGYKKSEIINQAFSNFISSEYQDIFYLAFREITKNKAPKDVEIRLVTNLKKIVWVKLRIISQKNSQNFLITVTVIDELKKAEFELKKVSVAINQSSNAIIITDINGNIEYANPYFTELTGYSITEAYGQNISMLNARTQAKELYLEMWKTIQAGNTWKGELHSEKKNGDLFWEDVTISPIKNEDDRIINYIAINEDITDKKYINQTLKESEEKISLLLNSTAEAIYGIDLNGKCTYANKACVEILGFKNENYLLGKNMHKLIHHSYANGKAMMEKNCKIYQVFEERHGTYADNEVFWRTDGTSFPVEYSSYPQFRDNKIVGAVITFTDISERLAIQKKLQKYTDKLKNLNATKDKLFSIIAHDLRSPFNSILGYSELLYSSINEINIEDSKMYSGIILSSANNTLILLDNLLNWAKSQSGQVSFKPEKLDLSSIILQVLELKYSAAKNKNIALNFKQSEEIEIYTDVNMLKLILRNLISNALKFTDIGGLVNISIVSKQNQVEITVSDNGVGMDKKTVNKLFNLSTNITLPGTQNEKGSGLGLVLCKEFAEKLGGKIWVESKIGKGSDFKFTLPLLVD